MFIKSKLFLFLLLVLVYACTTQVKTKIEPPQNLIQRDTMVDIIVDLRLFEASLSSQQKKGLKSFADYKLYLHNSILEKHQITREQFDESFEYYQYDLKTLDEIYADAITKLSKIKSQIEMEK